jgi:hypothetical protein
MWRTEENGVTFGRFSSKTRRFLGRCSKNGVTNRGNWCDEWHLLFGLTSDSPRNHLCSPYVGPRFHLGFTSESLLFSLCGTSNSPQFHLGTTSRLPIWDLEFTSDRPRISRSCPRILLFWSSDFEVAKRTQRGGIKVLSRLHRGHALSQYGVKNRLKHRL